MFLQKQTYYANGNNHSMLHTAQFANWHVEKFKLMFHTSALNGTREVFNACLPSFKHLHIMLIANSLYMWLKFGNLYIYIAHFINSMICAVENIRMLGVEYTKYVSKQSSLNSYEILYQQRFLFYFKLLQV